MLARTTADRLPRPNSLGDFGITSGSNPIVSLNEFTYKKGTEIYGEKGPAEYAYQIKTGAIRSYKLLTDGRRQIGAFHLVGDIFGLENLCRLIRRTVVFTSASAVNRYVPPGRK